MTKTPTGRHVFDRLHEQARPTVLDGTHRQDSPPADGGRWPTTIVSIPPSDVRARLEELMTQACDFAGPGHFLTGRADASHVTVRALEPYREAAEPTDEGTTAWANAMRTAAEATPPLRLNLTGLTLTTGSVMAQLEPVDEAPWTFMSTLREHLGPHAWFEDQWDPRDIWYANVLHFAAPIADPEGLVAWVEARRRIAAQEAVLDSVSLVRYRYRSDADGRLMRLEHWRAAPLGG
ncbi:hypothetical protein [Intrasporangium sp. YIM S08009]|uniref:hypothetical protein n=1 Tax=Intrasporangium zincisolvens TaxID=3080018 RepID=UPI002B05FA6A|nr:hypothetical protein [Intrasporangium sp. YIM S08009]